MVLVVPADRPIGESLVPSVRLAASWGTDLALLRPVVFPRQTPLDAVDEELDPHREELREVERAAEKVGPEIPVRGVLRVGRSLDRLIAKAATDLEAATVLVPGMLPTGPDEVASTDQVEAILEAIPGVGVAYREPVASRPLDALLAAVAGGPHSRAVARLAAGLATGEQAQLTLVHVLDPDTGNQEIQEVTAAVEGIVDEIGAQAELELMEAEDIVDGLLDAGQDYDALVVGAPTRSRLRHLLYGSTSRSLERNAPGWTFTVHADR